MFNLTVTFAGRSDVFVSTCLPTHWEFFELDTGTLGNLICECIAHAKKYGQVATFSNQHINAII